MSDKIELMRLCRVLRRNFSCLSQSDSQTQLCHDRIQLHNNNKRTQREHTSAKACNNLDFFIQKVIQITLKI